MPKKIDNSIHARLYATRVQMLEKRVELTKTKTEKGIEECHFTPNAGNVRKQKRQNKANETGSGEPAFERLFSRNLESRKFEGRTNDEIEYEKSKDAMTFRPSINPNKKRSSPRKVSTKPIE